MTSIETGKYLLEDREEAEKSPREGTGKDCRRYFQYPRKGMLIEEGDRKGEMEDVKQEETSLRLSRSHSRKGLASE